MEFTLGIDFGTSCTKVAICKDNNPPIPLPISLTGDKLFMPSVAAYKRTRKNTAELYAIGEDAERVPDAEDYCVIREVKRFLGVKENPPLDFRYQDYPWWDREKKCIQLWSTSLEIDDVIREILAEALRRTVRRVRELRLIPENLRPRNRILDFSRKVFRIRVKKADGVLTIQEWPLRFGCSVSAGLDTRSILRGVVRSLGFAEFKFESIYEEPVLASLPYLQRELHNGDLVLVYDFGGGTFDTALVNVEQNLITVLSADGEAFCGGTDIDRHFAEYLARLIAQKYFIRDYDRIYKRITDPMNAELQNVACQIKEILSTQTAYKVIMPPGFLDKPEIELDVTRADLEAVIRKSGILDQVDGCVLRGWRRARMILRKENEVCGESEFAVEVDHKTGKIKKDVFDLDFDDLSNMVNHVLLIGGTTRIPMVQSHLASFLGRVRFISAKDPYEPIVACALGACSHREHIGLIIDRLPFSIVAKQGTGETEMYRAYTRTVSYPLPSSNIENYVSEKLCIINADSDSPVIEFRTPDGEAMLQITNLKARPGRYPLKINSFGMIHFGNQEIDNPGIHPLQKAIWSRIEKEKASLAREESERLHGYLYGKDHHEVG